ncbi:Peptidase C1A propeptide [Trinorchestia longiramus]|nr:Peptidase C1A propeptide [Trinorchestia longiramus]
MTNLKLPVANKPKTQGNTASASTSRPGKTVTVHQYRSVMYDFVLPYMYYFLLFMIVLLCYMVILTPQDSNLGASKQVIVNIYKSVFDGDSEKPESFVENLDYVPYPLSDEFINHVNSKANTWKAGRNFHPSTSMKTLKRMMGALPEPHRLGSVHNDIPLKLSYGNTSVKLDNFDAREAWPQCPSIQEIRDQGGCGSCWAFGAAETMTDRHCITHGTQFRYSAEELVSCCESCGDGCNGGYPAMAFNYWKHQGIVSGGAYDSHQGCQPYEVPACEHHVEGPRPECGDVPTPQCQKSCIPEYNSTYEADKHFPSQVYGVIRQKEILNELSSNGPMEGTFTVYEDFLHYKSGVYQHVYGSAVGGHAVKVIGYGVEEDVPYYLCSNSWNYDWGMGGFFKIARDAMDRTMYTGIPDKRT